jgi:hypothetical protein
VSTVKGVIRPAQLELPTVPIEVGGTDLDLFDTELTRWLLDRRRRRFLLLSPQMEIDPTVFELAWEDYESVEPTRDGRGLVIVPVNCAAQSIYVFPA